MHNSDVVKSIIDAIGNDYDSAAIRGKIICSAHVQRGLEFVVCASVSVNLSICLPVCLYVCAYVYPRLFVLLFLHCI